MADRTRSDTDATLIKRGTVSVKTKRQQPFVLEVDVRRGLHLQSASRRCRLPLKIVTKYLC